MYLTTDCACGKELEVRVWLTSSPTEPSTVTDLLITSRNCRCAIDEDILMACMEEYFSEEDVWDDGDIAYDYYLENPIEDLVTA